jgi:hypothetical protein
MGNGRKLSNAARTSPVAVAFGGRAAYAAAFNTCEFPARLSDSKWADARIVLQPCHGVVDQRNGQGRARAAVHFCIEVAENNAGCWQQRWGVAHDFNDSAINIAI